MSNRRFEMYQYRQVIHRMRMGESDRTIARARLMGRIKCGQVRAIAGEQGWLDRGLPLPDDEVLVAGDPEWRLEEQRRREGMPLGAGTWAALGKTAARLGVAAPEVQ